MSPLLRGGLAVAGLAGAFAAGFFLRPQPTVAHAAGPAVVAAPTGKPVSAWKSGDAPQMVTPVVADLPPTSVPEPVDQSDPGYQMVKNALGIKTTILDKAEQLPDVLTAGRNDPALPPLPDVPRIEVQRGTPVRVAPPLKPVNTRDVALDFEVTKTGSSKVTAVELWTTRNGGTSWTKTDQSTGCQSPFRTRLGSDGHYGFRLVFESESGMRTQDPKPGQSPDLALELDMTPPIVTFYSPAAIPGEAGKVRLQWAMSDRNLDTAFVRLEYSEDGTAWHDLEAKANPQGETHFDWTLPPGVPPRVMLRVTARDRAGNYATVTSNQKAVIDLVAPEGKLTGLRPAGGEAGPMPREVFQ